MRSRGPVLAQERKSMPSTHKKVIVRKTDREAEAQAMEARATSIRADGD